MYTSKRNYVSSKASRTRNSLMKNSGFGECTTTIMSERELSKSQAQYITLENCLSLYADKGITTIVR